ncbi:ABC-type sugar transport system [Halomicronema hongdechloris C2206]|uniref:ABC-type sugar transport system n=1 Tax=Halomicronema hongdechloris C2206 TaxID=1641165 RepID=A0A1Z3HLK0_9CYAN|nr:ABC transporter ATP-binding protein [Halomicronema hongdechloris]ASC71146.1 ABC-type sugar transport system [Halomicronema hongdechloris C2206]
MARVRLEGITQRFGTATAIQDITLAIPDGEFWVLVGPSGCGKSTILRTIAGLEPVQEGRLYIGDTLVNQIRARQRDVAMVFQNYALYPHMTVAENLAFGLRMRHRPIHERQEQVHKIARSLDIAHLLDRKPRKLSGGQQQRVALGRAIVRKPQVFLLDEPLSNLDAQLRDDTRAELKQLHRTFGITTIYVTHDQVEAMTLADQIVVLHQGRIQQIATPQAVYAHPANCMVAAFMGSPPMNLLEATVEANGLRIDGQRVPLPALDSQSTVSVGQRVIVGLRPEHLQVSSESQASLGVTVTVVEPLGRETLVRTVLPDAHRTLPQSLNLQVSGKLLPQPGERLWVQLDPAEIFLFDPITGNPVQP